MVAPNHRRRGVATSLIRAMESEARRLGLERLYVGTASAASILLRRGWRTLGQGSTLHGDTTIYTLEL